MADIQKLIEKSLREIPILILGEVLAEKFKALDLVVVPAAINKLSELILSGKKDNLHVDGVDDNTVIEITDEELQHVLAATEKFYVEQLPGILRDAASRTADDLLKDLRKRWRKEGAAQKADVDGFKGRLEDRWGKALDLLRMLLTIVREWSDGIHKRRRHQKTSPSAKVMLRLHVRACQVVSEIIVLLENGFADGAMARWRTLHEIAIVAAVIAKYGDEIAERYMHYQIVESYTALIGYEQARVALNFKPVPKAESARVQNAYKVAIRRFGSAFKKEYGWAAHHLGVTEKDRLTFARLESEIDSSYMRAPYKMASYNVHASPKGAYFRLGNIDGLPTFLAGASNAGLTDPAQHTAVSFVQLTMLIIGDSARFDDLVTAQLLLRLQNLVPHEFWKAEKKLRGDDRRYRRSKKRA